MQWAWLIVLAAGCATTTDGTEAEDDRPSATIGGGNGESGAVTAAEAAGPIRVTVYEYGGDPTGAPIVEPNIQVDFIAPDQTKQTVFTDASGVAEVSSPPGTLVLVYQVDDGRPLYRSFAATNPGDSIIVDRNRRQSFPPLGSITFVLPRRGPQASYYELRASCTSQGGAWPEPTRTLDFASCPYATHATIVGWTHDGSGIPQAGASVMTNVDLTQLVGTTVRMPPYEPKATTATAELVSLPAGNDARWSVTYFNGDDPTPIASGTEWTPQFGATNSVAIVDVGTRTQSSLQFSPNGYRNVWAQEVVPARATTFRIDGNELIRPVGLPTYDRSIRTMSWPSAPYGRPATIVHATFGATTFGQPRVWIDMYAPGDTSSITLPPLPSDREPQATDAIYMNLELVTVEGETYSDSMELANTRSTAGASVWEPTFSGRVWTTGW
jgi:hypothetical protein